jgi:hypothetical protein
MASIFLIRKGENTMEIMSLLNQVNIENIFKTVLDLEGPRYPLENLKKLNETADYIIEKLESYGIEVEVQEFYVYGFEEPFRNIVGIIGDKKKPATIIGSHYDSVRNSPAANDNLSSVAVSLEVARLLSTLRNPPSVRIAVFTLEEGNPGLNKLVEDTLIEEGYLDSKGRYSSHKVKEYYRKIAKALRSKGLNLFSYLESYNKVNLEMKESFTKEEYKLFHILFDTLKEYEENSNVEGWIFDIGSYMYSRKVAEENIKISSIINMDTLGWIYTTEGTQKPLPIPKEMLPFVDFYKTEHNSTIGNFICVMGEKNSSSLLHKFLANCKVEGIELPYCGINMPLEFNEIVKMVPDTLRSDHTPFWKIGIPGIFISDTANFRSKFYHTGEDTYVHIDFDTLVKITKVTIKTLVE